MSDAFYNEMAAVVTELLIEFGQTWTITRTTGESIDDVTGAVTPGTDSTFEPNGVLLTQSQSIKMNSLIEQGDRILILDDTVLPLITDRPTIGGESWRIISIDITEPAGVPLKYEVVVRG